MQTSHESLRISLLDFVKEFWEVLEPGTPLELNWHHRTIARALEIQTVRINAKIPKNETQNKIASKDIIINVPPRTTKSMLVTVMFPVWAWTVNPTISFLTASYSGSLATKHARLSRTILQSDKFAEMFPFAVQVKTDQNVKSHYENTVGGERYAVGLGGSATGSGGDVIIVDDPTNPKEAASDKERENANRNFSETIYNRTRNPKTAVRIIVMQRLHEDDLTGYLLKNNPEAYYHINIPAEKTDQVKPKKLEKHYQDGIFWKDRFTPELLADYKKSLGSYGYAGQMLQQPAPPEGGMLKKAWFGIYTKIHTDAKINVYIDPAYGSKATNDPTGLLACYEHGGDYYIVRAEAVRFEFPDLMEYVQQFCREVGADHRSKIAVEPKASGKSLVQVLKRETNLNVVEDTNPTKDKVARVQDISPMVEAGRVSLLNGPWNDAFLNECAAFPNGAHDDMVDTLVMALNQNSSNFFVI